jgi:hypothetical protein
MTEPEQALPGAWSLMVRELPCRHVTPLGGGKNTHE